MDDKARKAEQLLEERSRNKKPNGHTTVDEDPTTADRPADVHADQPAERSEPMSTAEAVDVAKRLAADFSNYRKRMEAERLDYAKFAKADLIAKLLDVLDAYDRALATIPEELKTSSWVEGMWLIERKLRQILEAEGLQAIDSLGQPFDPYQHDAVAHIESDEPEGTVITEHQKAYRLHDRVIRPAMVTVAKKRE
jgi:molecular chaperone GrpE